MRLPLDLNWSVLGDVGRGALNTGNFHYGVTGEMIVSTALRKVRVPYSKAGRFSILGSGDR